MRGEAPRKPQGLGVIREIPRLVNSTEKTRAKRARFRDGIVLSHALRSTNRFAILGPRELIHWGPVETLCFDALFIPPEPREGNAMRQRKSDHPAAMQERLTRKHTDLSDRVATIDGRLHLTASDQAELASLKREKLAMKDALAALKREI